MKEQAGCVATFEQRTGDGHHAIVHLTARRDWTVSEDGAVWDGVFAERANWKRQIDEPAPFTFVDTSVPVVVMVPEDLDPDPDEDATFYAIREHGQWIALNRMA